MKSLDIEKLVAETIGFNEHDRDLKIKILAFVNKYKLLQNQKEETTIDDVFKE